jgi:hypothetical protein
LATPAEKDAVVAAVLYALQQGCFFPVRPLKAGDSVQMCRQWGALRHLHTAVAALPKPDPMCRGEAR